MGRIITKLSSIFFKDREEKDPFKKDSNINKKDELNQNTGSKLVDKSKPKNTSKKEEKKSGSLKSKKGFFTILKDLLTQNVFVVNYRRMWPYVKPYWFRALVSMLLCIPIGSLDAVIAMSLKPYTDSVLVDKSIASPWYIPLAIVAFTVFQGSLNYLATYLNTWVGGKITNALKHHLFEKLLSLETSFFDKKNSGDILFGFNSDADTACSGLLNNLKIFTQRICTSISLIGVLFWNSWQLAIVTLFVLGCAMAPMTRVRRRLEDVMKKNVASMSAAMTAYNEVYAGNKTITAYNLATNQLRSFDGILGTLFNLSIKMTQRTAWLSPVMHVITSIGIALAIGYGSHLILTKQITSGNFFSFITALILLYTPVKTMGQNFTAVQYAFMAIDRVFDKLNLIPTIKDKKGAYELSGVHEGIEFKNVYFEYLANVPVLKNINLHVKAGETVALVGNSGGGKTTIVNLLPRFYDIKSGSISIDGHDIRDISMRSLRQNMAVVFQDNFLFSGTIRENIFLGNPSASEEDFRRAIKLAYLDDFIQTLEKKENTYIGERGILLSGGQKQRIAIARAFLKNAPIVILDEATSALDNKAEAIVQKAIDNLMMEKTVFVIAHRLSTVQNADKIVVINQGEVVETGTHEELLALENGAYKALYTAQFKKGSKSQKKEQG